MATKTRTTKKLSKLERLREKMQGIGSQSKGYFNPKVGANVIRILPEVGDMEFFYQPVGTHVIGEARIYCPNFISDDELDCPICEIVGQLYRHGDKETAGKLRVQKKFWMNVIDRSNEEAGVLVFTPGVIITQTIAALINDPDYGEIYDVGKGIDITITRNGTGKETRYEVLPKPRPSKLGDPDVVEKWLSEARDLSWAELSDDPEEDSELQEGKSLWVLPYDRIIKEYDLDMDDFDALGHLEEDDEEEYPTDYFEADKDSKEEDDEEEKPQKLSEKLETRKRIRRRTR